MLGRTTLLTVLLCAAMVARIAQAAEAVTSFTLENGMEVVVIEDHRAPAVLQMVWYKAGAADEPAGLSGIAHVLEHLMFKGTETLEPGEFSAIVARHGGRDNAFTSYDQTAYFQRVPADQLELMMRLESDRMVNLRLSEADTLTERDVVLEERNQRVESDPGALFREQFGAVQYLNHPYGKPVIGWREELRALDRRDALRFYETYYAPNNAVLIISGDVTADKVRRLAAKYYGSLPANPDLPERARPQEPRQMAERRVLFDDPRVGQPYMMRGYLAPERDSGAQKQAAALTILADILGKGTASVLNSKLQFDEQVAVYSAGRYNGASLDDTTFTLFVAPAPGVTLQQAEAALDAALREFLHEGVDPDQLERVRTQARAEEIYARDDIFERANRYGQALTQGLTIEDVQAWPDILQSVTAEDVMTAARDLLDRKKSVTGWLQAPEVTQ